MTLFVVDEAASRIRDEVQDDAEIVVGAIFDRGLDGKFRVSVVATGLEGAGPVAAVPNLAAGQVSNRTLQ
jgi:cell division protein FtsZ